MNVQQILNSKPDGETVTVLPDASIAEAAQLLSERKIGCVVVSSGEGVVDGILSERDIVRELGKRGPACLNDKVSALMTAKVVACALTDKSEEVMQMMSEGRFRHMPVVKDGKMVGLISIGDVVKMRLSQLKMEKDALAGMIMGH